MKPRDPSCPRCGYDQSGIIASWASSCPMDGVCSECGLEFRWEEVLSGAFAPPRWSFEHTPWPSPGRWAMTYWRALAPPAFWRDLRLTHEVRPRRLIASIILCLVMCHIAVAATTGLRLYLYSSAAIKKGPAWRLPPWKTLPRPGTPAAVTVTPTQLMWQEVTAATLWPYDTRGLQWGTYTGTSWRPVAGYGFAALMVGAATIPPGFLVLGETFRRCRVRFVHLVRGTAYSLAGPGALALGGVALRGLVEVSAWPLLAPLGLLWLCVYWVYFVRVYLRLTHAAWVAGAMLTISGLCIAIALTFMWIYHFRGW